MLFYLLNPPAYEDAVDNPTAQSERERRIPNEQVKTALKNHCLRLETVGVLREDKPWKVCDPKASSLMYLTNALHVERNAIIVVSKITLRRFVKNIRTLIPTQHSNRVSITLKKKIIKLMMLIKFRPIIILIWNLTIHRMKTTVLHQYLQRILHFL